MMTTRPAGDGGLAGRPKVLLVAPVGAGVGGIISQSNELVEALRNDRTIDLRVIDSTQRYRADHDLRVRSRVLGGAWHGLGLAARFCWRAMTFRPDVVHLRSSASLGLVRDVALIVLGRLAGARVYLQLHFGRIPELAIRRNWEWRLLVAACRASTGVCVLDRRSQEVLVAHGPRTVVHLIPNGVNCDWIDRIVSSSGTGRPRRGVATIVFVGMAIPAKGVVELVEACCGIDSARFELEVVGPVGLEMRSHLEKIAGGREPAGWLRFSGELSRSDAVARVAAADLFVLPSHTEGFPISVLEAMACQTAIVATDVGAVREVLTAEDGRTAGVVVPARDVAALRSAVEGLLTDASKRHELGAAARRRCEACYQFSTLVRRLVDLWSGREVPQIQVSG